MNFLSDPIRNYGYKEFHKTNFESPSKIVMTNDRTKRNTRKHDTFHSNGIDKPAVTINGGGLQYGSGQEYSRGTRIVDKTSTEIIKQKLHQKEANENIKTYNEQRRNETETAILTKKRDLEMLKHQYPWGKQRGGGAPKISQSGTMNARIGKFDFRSNADTPNDYNPFGRPGGGAPIKSNSGKCVTALVGDPNIRFQKQFKKEIDQTLRYKNQESHQVYSPLKVTRSPSEIERRDIERKKKEIYAKKLEEQRVESQERKRRVITDDKFSPQYNPWGRDIPPRDDSGNLQRRRRGVDSMGVISVMTSPGTNKGSWLSGLGERQVMPKRRNKMDNDEKKGEGYNPWGRPGCGAPLATTSGKIITDVRTRDLKSKQQQQQENEIDSLKKAGHGISVAEWLRNGKVGQPLRDPNCNNVIVSRGKNTSDVTAHSLDIHGRGIRSDYHTDLQEQADHRQMKQEQERNDRIQEEKKHLKRLDEIWPHTANRRQQHNPLKQQEYFNDLQQMVETRIEHKEQERKKQCEKENEHVTAFNHVWGRPGGGAPRTTTNNELDASPRSYGTLNTFMTHQGQNKFRRL